MQICLFIFPKIDQEMVAFVESMNWKMTFHNFMDQNQIFTTPENIKMKTTYQTKLKNNLLYGDFKGHLLMYKDYLDLTKRQIFSQLGQQHRGNNADAIYANRIRFSKTQATATQIAI